MNVYITVLDDIADTMPEAPSPSMAPRNKGPPSSGLGMKKAIQMQRKKMQVIDIRVLKIVSLLITVYRKLKN